MRSGKGVRTHNTGSELGESVASSKDSGVGEASGSDGISVPGRSSIRPGSEKVSFEDIKACLECLHQLDDLIEKTCAKNPKRLLAQMKIQEIMQYLESEATK